jgi:zinc protease
MRAGAVVVSLLALVLLACSHAAGPAERAPKVWRSAASADPSSVKVPKLMDQRPTATQALKLALPAARRAVVQRVPVVALEKRDLPLVAISVLIEAGVADEPAPGVACATAALLDEGAGRRDAIALATAFAQLGTRPQIDCRWDYTVVRVQLLRRHFAAALPLIFDLVRRPRFRKADVERTLAQLHAQALARRAQPARVAQLVLRRALFAEHPYGRPPLALPRQIKRLTRRQLIAFHRRYYRRPRVAVVVAGDVSLEEAAEWLRPHLLRWPAGAPRRRLRKVRVRRRASPDEIRLVLVERSEASQSVLRVGSVGPGAGQAKMSELRLNNVVLGGSFTSRLNQKLREKQGVTYGAFSALWFGRAASVSWAGTSVQTSATVEAVQQLIGELRGLAQNVPSEQELAKARRVMFSALAERFETVGSINRSLVEIVARDLPLDQMQRLVDRAEAAAPAQLGAVARNSSLAHPTTLVIVGDLARIGPALRARFGAGQQVDSDGRPVADNFSQGP